MTSLPAFQQKKKIIIGTGRLLRVCSLAGKKIFMTSKHFQICPGLNANEIQIPYDKHHKVSSLVKGHQNTHNSVKYEVISYENVK